MKFSIMGIFVVSSLLFSFNLFANPLKNISAVEGGYSIANCDDLQNINQNPSANYVLSNDIDCSDTKNWNNGAGFNPIQSFSGKLEGQNYSISNLYINRPAQTGVGLFAVTKGSIVISNVRLINLTLNGLSAVGSLAGRINGGTISKVYVNGNISGVGVGIGGLVGIVTAINISNAVVAGNITGSSRVGGLTSGSATGGPINISNTSVTANVTATSMQSGSGSVGGFVGGGINNSDHITIMNSYMTGNVTAPGVNDVGGLVGGSAGGGDMVNIFNSYATGNVVGAGFVGGLAGMVYGGTISNSYATGNITGGSYNVGGLVGQFYGVTLSNNYALGAVTGTSGVGGLVGFAFGGNILNTYSVGKVSGSGVAVGGLVGGTGTTSPISISNSYYDTDTSGQRDVGKGIPVSDAAMKQKITFSNWDFKNIWVITEGTSYPAFGENLDPYFTEESNYFLTITNQPQVLQTYLINIPKGADLHNHLVGAAYPSWLISYAQGDSTMNWCVDRATFTATTKPICAENQGILLNNTLQPGSANYKAIVNAWSMQGFPQGYNSPKESHDHFFAAFKKFTPLVSQYIVQVLADLMTQAASEHINYLELMARTGDASLIRTYSDYIINLLPADPNQLTPKNVTDAITELERHNFTINVVNGSIISSADLLVKSAKTKLQCNQPNPPSACQIVVEFQYAPSRNEPFAQLFTGLYAGMVAMQQLSSSENPNYVVGINLVGTEDDATALKYYDAQMKLIQYLKQAVLMQYPKGNIKISLHAGELTKDFVSPDNLTFHINNAVNVAKTTRVGHGVDIVNELPVYPELISQMQQNYDMVEINLTSNEQILWVCDNANEPAPKTQCKSPNQNSNTQYNHPFYAYLASNIPATISTDDQGVEQTDLSQEYYKAVTRYGLTYAQLKNIDRDSLDYSFLQGQGLWKTRENYTTFVAPCANDNPYVETIPSTSCQAYLTADPKAQAEWNLEQQFAQFESNIVGRSEK